MWIWFLAFPFLEFFTAVQVAGFIGVWWFINLLILGGFLGMLCLRKAGTPKLEGPMEPTRPLILFLAGLLFIFPGVVSDVLALLLLIPWARRILVRILLGPIRGRVQWQVYNHQQPFGSSEVRDVTPGRGEIIDILPESSTDQAKKP